MNDVMIDVTLTALYSLTPPILLGPPGVGKTSFARKLAQQIGAKSYVVCLSHKESTEIHGIPVVAKEQFEYQDKKYTIVEQAPPDYALEAVKAKTPIFILFDELNCISPAAAAPALAILGENRIADLMLDLDNVGIAACANPTELAAGGWYIPPPMANRIVWLKWKLDALDWANNFPSFWGSPPDLSRYGKVIPESIWGQKRALVAAFIRQHPDHLLMIPEDVASRSGPWPSPRTWEFVSRQLAVCERDGKSSEVLYTLIEGDVGTGAMTQFSNWIETMDLPDPRTILDNPALFVLPPRTDQLFYILLGCTAEVIHRKQLATAAHGNKKADEYAAQSWVHCWNLLGHVVKQGGDKGIAAIAANILAQKENHPRGAVPPTEVSLFLPIIQAAGLNWRQEPKKGR